MCRQCEKALLGHLNEGDTFHTVQGKSFTMTYIDRAYSDRNGRGKIEYRLEGGGRKWCHIEHLGICYHWMDRQNREIEGVGAASSNSVRSLVGENGRFARCTKCERNPAYIWGILNSHPSVQLGRGRNYLKIP